MIVLDRYEGDFAIIEEDDKLKKIPRDALCGSIPEGSVLKFQNERYFMDTEATAARRKKLLDLQNSLFD